MLKPSDLREKPVADLREDEKKLSEKIFKFRMELASGRLTDTSQINQAKKDLARVKTIIAELTTNKSN